MGEVHPCCYCLLIFLMPVSSFMKLWKTF
ncbi:hypothetical protein CAEBREN_17272 [Caenorhabditis brenneri]|uniref:Uncharacterized protein n=1 Tax=Caenorhabditis brenneri TaxID=135651 RepID=G0MR94_CAEBE|nr:hypothetical protein CAEBREN_17272 [Caenorhabditis brenneri]